MRVTADRSTCATSSLCVYAVPQVFDQDEDEGLVVIVETFPAPALQDVVRKAARGCPTGSIQIHDE
jgi:ferredoxin